MKPIKLIHYWLLHIEAGEPSLYALMHTMPELFRMRPSKLIHYWLAHLNLGVNTLDALKYTTPKLFE